MARDKTDILLDEMMKTASGNYEAFDEDGDNILGRNLSPSQMLKVNRINQLSRSNPSLMGIPKVTGMGANKPVQAQFDIKITATSNSTTQPVFGTPFPYVIFGAAALETGYYNLLGATSKPAGVSWGSNNSAFQTTTAGAVLFTGQTSTMNVAVTSKGVDYPMLLRALLTDNMKINRLRVTIANSGDANGLASIQDDIVLNTLSIFGKKETNPISLTAFKRPDQQQVGIIDIPLDFYIDKNFYLTGNIYPAITSTTSGAVQQIV